MYIVRIMASIPAAVFITSKSSESKILTSDCEEYYPFIPLVVILLPFKEYFKISEFL